jgi:thiamine biosynthesis protein ThiI
VKYELILVRYGEIALKGKETRKRFENILVSNIKNAFDQENIINKISKERGRIYIYTNKIKEAINVLKKIFGIISISPSIETTSNINSISHKAINISKEYLDEKKSFALRITRTGDQKFTSQDAAVRIGNDIVNATKTSVDLTNPDFELFIEIRNDKAYLFIEKINGFGGMPIGSQGKILAFIDTPYAILASWYLIHRGCKPIFFSTDESNKDVLEQFMNHWFIKSIVINVDSKDNLYKQIGKTAAKYNCDAIVSRHTLFDKSENILSHIKQLKKQTNLPVLHPLIAMDIEEINRKCREIGLSI